MNTKAKSLDKEVSAIDIFCGAGGLTKGLSQAGINVKLGVDIDPICEYPYIVNNNAFFLRKSIEDLQINDLEFFLPKRGILLLAGCAPCQTFSKYNQKATPADGRWWLLQHFLRLILEIKPQLVTMENVPGICKQDVFNSFITNLKLAKYNVSYQIVNCVEYGIPQQRSRLVLLASLYGPIRLLTPKEVNARQLTVRDVISNLPVINAGEVNKRDPLHQSSFLSPINLRRIRASRPGGTWRDWDINIVARCHIKSTGKHYSSVYGRMNWDEPAPTITTQFFGFGNGRFGHPEQDRAISLREGAILQSFPKNYAFHKKNEPINKKRVGRLIGNAVPVKLGKIIGKSILHHIKKNNITDQL